MSWTREEAFEFCRIVESIAPAFGGHVALTGGLLYKDGPRKDCDILIYRIREHAAVDFGRLFFALEAHGCIFIADYGWCKKLTWRGKNVDVFNADDQGLYPVAAPTVPTVEAFLSEPT